MTTREVARFQPNYLFADSWNRDASGNVQLNTARVISYTYLTSFPHYYTNANINQSSTLKSLFPQGAPRPCARNRPCTRCP